MPTKRVNGFSMHYEDTGSGEPLVFYHGWLNAGNVWDAIVEELKSSYRCIVLDGRGTGQSETPPDGYSIAQYADDMLGLADALGIDRFTAVGFSLGGAIATQAALKAPGRVQRMVLLGSPVDPNDVAPELMANIGGFSELVVGGNRDAVAGFIHSITARRSGPPDARLVDAALACSDGFVRSIASLADFKPGPTLASLQTPTLVIGGAADPFLSATLAAAQRLPNATLHVFNRVSHGMPWEVPAQVAEVINDFMENGVVTAASLAAG